MSSARKPWESPYHGAHLRAKLAAPPDISTEAGFNRYFAEAAAQASGTGDPRSLVDVCRDTLRDLLLSETTSAATKSSIVFRIFERLGGKPMVHVQSSGDGPTSLTIVEEQNQNLFLSDPGYQARILEIEDYARRAAGDRCDEPGAVRGDREPGPVDDAAAPGDAEPEAG